MPSPRDTLWRNPTSLAPARMVSMLIVVWCLSQFAGNHLAGYEGRFWDPWPKEYFFLLVSGVAALEGIVILILLKPVQRAMDS